MHRKTTVFFLILLGLTRFVFAQTPASVPSQGEISAATGWSAAVAPREAGLQAAQMARAALTSTSATVVLVADHLGQTCEEKQALLEGVARVFDPNCIYGCDAFGMPITQAGSQANVGVLALAGAIGVHSALVPVNGNHEACGEQIAQQLRATVQQHDGEGKLLILLGDCHVPANDALVSGAHRILGEGCPIMGASHPIGGHLYHQGKIYENHNMGLLLTGPFEARCDLRNGEGVEGIVQSAGEAARQAAGPYPDSLLVLLAFDCAARMATLGESRPQELDAMKLSAGQAPIFGFYSSGEIGMPAGSAEPRGVGVHLATCALLRKRAD